MLHCAFKGMKEHGFCLQHLPLLSELFRILHDTHTIASQFLSTWIAAHEPQSTQKLCWIVSLGIHCDKGLVGFNGERVPISELNSVAFLLGANLAVEDFIAHDV